MEKLVRFRVSVQFIKNSSSRWKKEPKHNRRGLKFFWHKNHIFLYKSTLKFSFTSLKLFYIPCAFITTFSLVSTGRVMVLLKVSRNKNMVTLHTFDGVPRTLQILKISSISLLPGNSGLSVYSSAMMQPTAQMSMGEL